MPTQAWDMAPKSAARIAQIIRAPSPRVLGEGTRTCAEQSVSSALFPSRHIVDSLLSRHAQVDQTHEGIVAPVIHRAGPRGAFAGGGAVLAEVETKQSRGFIVAAGDDGPGDGDFTT